MKVRKEAKSGSTCRTANNAVVKDEGVKKFGGDPEDGGMPLTIAARTLQIKRPLMSVYGMTQAGWRVVFDSEGSYAQQKHSGRLLSLKAERRGWNLCFKVCSPTKPNTPPSSLVSRSIQQLDAVSQSRGAGPGAASTSAGPTSCSCNAKSGHSGDGSSNTTSVPALFEMGVNNDGRWCPFGRLPIGVRPGTTTVTSNPSR